MLRHPIYLFLCLASCGYLLWSNTRGWTPFYAAKTTARRYYGGSHYFHK